MLIRVEAELEDGGVIKVKTGNNSKTHHRENGKLWYMYKMNYHTAKNKNELLILGIA